MHLPVISDDEILDRIGIATPCEADWASMRGNERVRHCRDCKLNVYDVSAMTRRQAVALIRTHEGRLCVRLLRRADSTLITEDCWARLRAARRRGMVPYVCTLVLVGLAQVWLQLAGLRAAFDRSPREVGNERMGQMMMTIEPLPAPPIIEAIAPLAPTSERLEALGVLAPNPGRPAKAKKSGAHKVKMGHLSVHEVNVTMGKGAILVTDEPAARDGKPW